MNNQLLKNQSTNERDAIASRRGFLTRMAYGSLLAMGSSGIVHAAAKHITHAAPPPAAKKSTGNVKSVIHERLALKTEHNRNGSKADDHHAAKDHDHHHEDSHHASKDHDDNHHASKNARDHDSHHHAEHHELASNNHSRIHTSLNKDHDGGYRVHHEERERLALESSPRTHPSLRHEIPDFATQAEMELDESNSFSGGGGRIVLPNSNARFSTASHKTLALQNLTTGDSLNVTYFERGRYLPDALSEINFIYRDHLTDDIHPIDTALLDQLHELQSTLGVSQKTIHVVCGYRSPFTNAYLRRNSSGVARNSLHMQGRAIDIRIAGVDSRTVRDAALNMASGGVGYYPGSNFVHLDTGDIRTW